MKGGFFGFWERLIFARIMPVQHEGNDVEVFISLGWRSSTKRNKCFFLTSENEARVVLRYLVRDVMRGLYAQEVQLAVFYLA